MLLQRYCTVSSVCILSLIFFLFPLLKSGLLFTFSEMHYEEAIQYLTIILSTEGEVNIGE